MSNSTLTSRAFSALQDFLQEGIIDTIRKAPDALFWGLSL